MAITQNDPITASGVVAALNEKANSSHTHATSDITDFPTIPTKTSELTNDSGFATGTIPTKTSQLENDSGFLAGLPSHNHDERYYTESEVNNILWSIAKNNRVVLTGENTYAAYLPPCNVSERKYFNCLIFYTGGSRGNVTLQGINYEEV